MHEIEESHEEPHRASLIMLTAKVVSSLLFIALWS